MDKPKRGGLHADDVIVVVAWVFAIGLVFAAAWGSRLLIEPMREVFQAFGASQQAPLEPDSNEASVELGILYPVNGPVPNETEMRAAGMSDDEAEQKPMAQPPGVVVVPPSWLQAPRPYYPSTAAYRNVEGGRVQMECFVRPDGIIAACIVLNETPPGLGFGRAAIAAARDARLQARTVDGVASPGRIRFTTSFRLQ
ncbi:TonB family protein [Brevundimonas sp.]|uniref:TonB family protein n=1 Tax=Brevundimonas sp. TaxID=1871086 RepID=UPI003BA98400